MAVKIAATVRHEFGKGAARRARRAKLIPAVVYGHGQDPLHITLPSHDTFLALKDSSNTLFELDIEGTPQLALTKDVQRHPVTYHIEHVDLVVVTRDEKVEVEVPLVLQGDAADGTVVNHELTSLLVQAPVVDIPESIAVDIQGLEAGARIEAKDLALPDDVVLEVEPDTLVVSVNEFVEEVLPEPEAPDEEAVAEGDATVAEGDAAADGDAADAN